MNLVYTALMHGISGATMFLRRTDSSLSISTAYRSVRGVLVPVSDDPNYRAACAEQLVQLCRRSSLTSLLAELDPKNTYAHEFTTLEASTSFTGVPANCQFMLAEQQAQYGWIARRVNIVFDLGAGSATVDGTVQDIATADNLTSSVELGDGLSCRLAGEGLVPAPSTFSIVLSLVRPPLRSLLDIDGSPVLQLMPWVDKYKAWTGTGSSVSDRVVAAVLNYAEEVSG